MAHQDIRRLTNELDAAKNNNLVPSGVSQWFIQEIVSQGSYHNCQQLISIASDYPL